MANLITLGRLGALFAFVVWFYTAPPSWQIVNPVLLAALFLLDAVDGFVARFQGGGTVFGAVLDIAVDRVVENGLWLVLVERRVVPLWVALLFLTRSFLVDALRTTPDRAPFDTLRSSLGRLLVKGRTMRFLYGATKCLAFGAWFLVLPLRAARPEWLAGRLVWLEPAATALVYAAVGLCLVRAAPVLAEAWLMSRGRRAG